MKGIPNESKNKALKSQDVVAFAHMNNEKSTKNVKTAYPRRQISAIPSLSKGEEIVHLDSTIQRYKN